MMESLWWKILPPQIWDSISLMINVIIVSLAVMWIVHFFFKERKEDKDNK